VFSKNSSRAKKIASQLESGVVTVNDHLYTHGLSETPWGGWKESGLGRTHGFLGLKEMSNVRCVNTDMLPSSWSPRDMWWYPFSADTYKGVRSVIGFVSPKSIGERLKSVATLLPFAVKMMFRPWNPVDTEKKSA